jgi:hypothetical protein
MWYCYFENENLECEAVNVVRGDERVECYGGKVDSNVYDF